MNRLRIVWVVALVVCGAALAQEAETLTPEEELVAALQDERDAAYDAILAGQPWDGAVRLLEAMRLVPGNEPRIVTTNVIDEAGATLRLLVFDMTYLLTEEQRTEFLSKVVNTARYPTDTLVQLRWEVASGLDYPTAKECVKKLEQLSTNAHPIARIGALAILSSPYYFNKWLCRPKARERIAAEFPHFELTRVALRASLYQCKKADGDLGEALGEVLETGDLSTRATQATTNVDPVVQLVRTALPDLRSEDGKGDGVAAICDAARTQEDWSVRFGCMNLLNAFHDRGFAGQVEEAVGAVAARDGKTPDVLRAQCLMLGYAKGQGDAEGVKAWGEKLLAHTKYFDPLGRTLHEEVLFAVQRYADYLAEEDDAEAGAAVYDRLAAKYPNSALATESLQKAAKLHEGAEQ